MRKKTLLPYQKSLVIPAVLIFSFFFVLPVLASFVLAFTDWNLSRFTTPVWNGLDNFLYIFTDRKFGLSVKNTFIFAIFTASLKTLLGLFVALAVNRPLKTRNLLRTVYYMPAVLSMVVVGIMFDAIFRFDGMFNQFLGTLGLESLQQDWVGGYKTALPVVILADVWRWTGFNMAVFLAGLQSIPNDYYEAARIDGASSWQQFRRITVALLMPAFTVNIVFNTIGGLKVFEQVFVITGGGPGFASQVFSTYIYSAFSQGLLGRSTAMSLILFITVFTLSTLMNTILKKKEVS